MPDGTSNLDKLPWTTGRCNRLLRPITSQLIALSELAYPQLNASATSAAAISSGPAPSSKAESRENDDESTRIRGRKGFDDPDWMPKGPEKRGTKRLYSNRSAKADARPAPDGRKPGEISMPTPLVARHVQFDEPMQPLPQKHSGWRFLQTPKKQRFALPKRDNISPGTRLRHIQRLLQSFRTLLQATEPPKSLLGSRIGTRSLMSTCLRKVPVYIEGRQNWEDEESSEKIDASDEIYRELEEMGAASGWRPLREVVRAHGVAQITAAIAEKLLDTDPVEQIVRLCHQSQAFDEAEEVLSAFAFATASVPPPRNAKDDFVKFEDPRFRGIAAAHAWAERTQEWAFFYRLVRSLLLSNLLPIEWTATTNFKNIWSRIIRNISNSSDPAHADACKLSHTALSLACGRNPSDIDEMWPDAARDEQHIESAPASVNGALNTTVSSLSAIFAAIFLLPDEEADYGREGRHLIRHVLESVALDITYDVLRGRLDDMVSRSSSTIERLSNMVTCAIVVGVYSDDRAPHIAESPVATHIRALTRLEEATREQLLNLPAIVCSIAETCGRAYLPKSPENVFQVLKSIVEALKSYRVSASDDGQFTESTLSSQWETVGFPSWFLKRLALDSAADFADHAQDTFVGNSTEHIRFALSVEKEMQRIEMPQHDKPFFHKDIDYHVGYRWESGISEWVEATPMARHSDHVRATSPPAHSAEILDDALPSSPIKLRTPARPTLSQLLLANSTPDVLSYTPSIFSTTPVAFSNTPACSSTPVPAALESSDDEDTLDDGEDTVEDGDDVDELALTSPFRPTMPSSPPRKRPRKSGGRGGGGTAADRRPVTTLSAAFGLDGADDSGDELSFL